MNKHPIVSEANFHAAVKTANGTPENAYNMNSEKAHRRVNMKFNEQNGFLMCSQEDPKTGRILKWAIPSANIISILFADELEASKEILAREVTVKEALGKEKGNKKN